MRVTALILAVCVAAFVTSCGEAGPTGEPVKMTASGNLVVFVYWDGQGLADMRVELVELGQELTTNDEGLAEFVAPTGDYTLPAYDINMGGPALRYVDTDVTVEPKKTTRVEILNCLPCV